MSQRQYNIEVWIKNIGKIEVHIMKMKIIEKENGNYPKQLLKIKQPPEKLYILGDERLLQNLSLAIVGSRSCSEYGIKHTKEFAKEIAEAGITVISGLALGIDTVAHEVAQNRKGKTIAVVGCGFDYIYPEENKELFCSILTNGGCIISEYETNEPIDMRNFPKRNRIISGLSDGVLVVEAGYKSGSGITGRLALEQKKKVFCLPRNLGESKGIGTNELIQKGAKLVIKPQDILQEFGVKNKEQEKRTTIQTYQTKTNENKTKKEREEEINGKQNEIREATHIPKEYMNIYQFTSYTPQNIQYFAKRSGLKIAEVTQKLIMLELHGYIKSLPRKLLY